MSKPSEDEGPRSFIHFIGQLDDGDVADRLTNELYALTNRIRESALNGGGDTGALTLKIEINVKNADSADLAVSVEAREPKKKKNESRLWISKAGNLVFEKPRQGKLDFGKPREVGGNTDAREVGERANDAREV